jgi:hypothetical protein
VPSIRNGNDNLPSVNLAPANRAKVFVQKPCLVVIVATPRIIERVRTRYAHASRAIHIHPVAVDIDRTFARFAGAKLTGGKLSFPFRIESTIENPEFSKGTN